jgi:hypothetical protein
MTWLRATHGIHWLDSASETLAEEAAARVRSHVDGQ